MAAKKQSKSLQKTQEQPQRPRWVNLLLALTLLPIISGGILLVTPLLGFNIFEPREMQWFFGLFLLFSGFALSNYLQKKWMLAVGWTALALCGVLLWFFSEIWIQAAAVALGCSGLASIVYEFWQRTREKVE